MVKILGIHREMNIARKPGSDQRILNLTAEELKKMGYEVEVKTLKELRKEDTADIILNMARSQEINDILFEKELQANNLTVFIMSEKEQLCEVGPKRADIILNMARGHEVNRVLFESESQGVFFINSPKSTIFVSNKKELHQKLSEAGVGTPETKAYKVAEIKLEDIKEKSILKAANRHSLYYVVEVGEADSFDSAMEKYREKGIEEIIVQKFVEGRFVKYYAVGDMVFLPDGAENDLSHEVVKEIKRQIGLIEKVTGLSVLGGDLIVSGNEVFIVDVNDFPSFSGAEGVHQEDVAPYIAKFVQDSYLNFKKNK